MITAAGAGAAFCAPPSSRLRPKAPRNTHSSHSNNSQQGAPLVPVSSLPIQRPQIQESSSSPPSVIQSMLLNKPKSTGSGGSSTISPGPSLLDSENDYDTRSLASIRQDDFFRSYQTPSALADYLDPPSPKSFYSVATSSSGGTARAAQPGRNSFDSIPSLPSGDLHSSSPPRSHPRNRLLPVLDFTGDLHSDGRGSDMRAHGAKGISVGKVAGSKRVDASLLPKELLIAVVGAPGSGKSTFIQKAFNLTMPASKNTVYSRTVPFDKYLYEVRMIEMDVSSVDIDRQPIGWPRTEDGQKLQSVDGVLLLYDVTNRSSIEYVPKLHGALSRSGTPSLLVSCKCDMPLSSRRIDPSRIESLGVYSGVETLPSSVSDSATQKNCIIAIITAALERKTADKNTRYVNGRRRANSSVADPNRQTSPRPPTSRSGHSRASSEYTGTFLADYSPTSTTATTTVPLPRNARSVGNAGLNFPTSPTAPLTSLTLDTSVRAQATTSMAMSGATPLLEVVSTNPFSLGPQSRNASVSSAARADSFLDMDDDSLRDPDDVPILEREDSILDDDDEEAKNARANGLTWDELVDKLLSQSMSKSDQNFNTTFLCFYRKIAPPRELLDAILDRFERANTEEPITLHRIEKQIRYCTVLASWVSTYPGDFSHPSTRQRFQSFISAINSNRSFALLAKEMSQSLQKSIEDEDACWGRSDAETDRTSSISSFLSESSQAQTDSSDEFFSSHFTDQTLHVPESDSRRPSDAPSNRSIMTTTSMISSSPGPGMSSQMSIREQYTQFMAIPDESIANELTRIDWSEFSQIRPRDLVRHVSIPPDQKEKCKSLEHVNRMISHFNHVAYWVANIILERPKAKHRARALEKFMNIAWLLRHKNNYNALGAVIAGINGTAVHRLSLTRELVTPETQKKFMRLELLMSTHKSHFAYRLAWENTSTQRIPFLPLHRRDLVSADEGNRTYLQDNDRINWNKFQVMGDVLMVIIKSQAHPYTDLQRNPVVEKLILDAVVSTNDDDLYERSVQLESSVGPADSKRKRMWFGQR